MDPLSAAASIIAVIQITGTVLDQVNQYRKSVKKAHEEIEQILSDLTSLQVVLQQVLAIAEREKNFRPNSTSSLTRLTVAGGELDSCRDSLGELQRKLQPRDGWKGVKDTLTWHFKAEDVKKSMERIAKSRDVLNLAVTADNALVSLGIQEEVATLTASFNSASLDTKQQKALDWLGNSTSSDKQNSARRKHQTSTGTWLLNSTEYTSWKTGQKRLLWLHGIPGCGKTILCSSVINNLISHVSITPKTAIAYYYFDFNNPQEANLLKLLKSIVTQLALQDLDALTLLVKEYTQHDSGRRSPSVETLTDLLTDMLRIYKDSFLVIDALDECQDRDELLDCLNDLYAGGSPSLLLFLTSRKEKDIDDVLKSIANVEVTMQDKDVDPDIRLYIRDRLARDRKLKKWPATAQDEIEQSLMARVNGMFRMAECQLDMLSKCNTLVALRKQLQGLPRTLDGTYDQILASISPENAADALKVLQWLSFSARPLLLPEIIDVLAIDDRKTFKFNPDLRYIDQYDVLTICSSLITLHPRKVKRDPWGPKEDVEELRLAHLSVKEYLVSERTAKGTQSFYHLQERSVSTLISDNCVIYLSQFREYNYLNKQNITEHALATYAAKYWPQYAGRSEQGEAFRLQQERIATLLASTEICRNWLSLWNPDCRGTTQSDLEYIELDKPIKDKEIKEPLYYACVFGLLDVSEILLTWTGNPKDIDYIAGERGTLLHAATYSGNVALVQLLIEKGSDINAICGESGTALACAAEYGHEDVVDLLLKNGADPNVAAGFYGSALQAAACQGSSKNVKALLEHGARVNISGRYSSALAAAIENGHGDVVEMLLKQGIDINAQTTHEDSALHTAASKGSLRAVKLLLSKGAKIDLQGHYGGTPLLSAVSSNHVDIAEYLLQQGADPNVKDTLFGDALFNAADRNNLEMVRLLLNFGADINSKVRETGTALASAISKGNLEITDVLLNAGADAKTGSAVQAAMKAKRLDIAQKLIEKGANIHEYSGEYGYPLQSAAISGNLTVVEFLVKNAADINARGGSMGTALEAAVCLEGGSIEVARYLISQGADLNVKGGDYDSPLQAAAQNESDNTARVILLLNRGAKVNLRSGRTGTALHAACESNNSKIAEVLLRAGADINARHDGGWSPLHIAISNEFADLAEFLLEKDALFNSRHQRYNDLHQAADRGMTAIVRKLLDLGADVNGMDEDCRTALHEASRNGHVDTIKLLLDRGANIHISHSKMGTIAHVAASSESLLALKMLVVAGADVHPIGGDYHTTLQAAAYAEEFKNVQYLLELGIDVNVQGGEYGTALQAAAANGDRNIVKALLDAGARVDLGGGEYGGALQAAAQNFGGAVTVIKMLIDAGADVNFAGGTHGTALQAAARNGSLENVKILMSHNANVNTRGGECGTALLAAAESGSADVVDYLLAHGADSFIIGPLGNALYHAGAGGNQEIIQTFLDLGHEIKNAWGENGSALKMTINAGSINAFRLLLDKGASVNETCGGPGSALLESIRNSESEYLDFLLEAGADPNRQFPQSYEWTPSEECQKKQAEDESESATKDHEPDLDQLASSKDYSASSVLLEEEPPKFVNALHEALCQEDEDIKQLILSKTTDINAPGGEYGSALQAALVHCHLGLVHQILDRGADIHDVGGEYYDALQAAATTGELKRVKLVLSYSPAINQQGGKWGNALQAAAQGGYHDVVEHLLDNGAEVDAQGGEYLTALQAAAYEGHYDVVDLLIARGSDINIYTEEDGDALQAAASQGHVRIVRLLARKKAIAKRPSKKYKNAFQAAVDGGYLDVATTLIRGWTCFRRGDMLEAALKSLTDARHFNLAKKIRDIAQEVVQSTTTQL